MNRAQDMSELRAAIREGATHFRAQPIHEVVLAWPLKGGLAAGCVVVDAPGLWIVEVDIRATADGAPVISKLLISPADPAAPVQAVTGTVLRSLNPSQGIVPRILQKSRERTDPRVLLPVETVAGAQDVDRRAWHATLQTVDTNQRRRKGRPSKDPEDYRRVAELCVRIQDEKGHADIDELCARLPNTPPRKTVDDWIRKARDHGYLMPAANKGSKTWLAGPNLG